MGTFLKIDIVANKRHIPVLVRYETFARTGSFFSGKAKTHAMREFIIINDRLSTFLPTVGALGDAARGKNNNRAKVSLQLFTKKVKP